MIDALISGQAAAYAILGKMAVIHDLEGHEATLPKAVVGLAFQGCTDVRQIKAKSEKEVSALCKLERNVDRALRLLLIVIESEGPADQFERYVGLLEALLENPFVLERVEEAMYVAPLPNSCDTSRLAEAFQPYRILSTFFNQLMIDQPTIDRVRGALDAVPSSTFDSRVEHRAFLAAVFSSGFQRELVFLIRSNKQIDLAVLKFIGEFRHVEGARDAIQLWTADMRSGRKPIRASAIVEEEDIAEDFERRTGEAGRRILERILVQQNAIKERLKARDLNGARRFAKQLIDQQAAESNKDQIGKSLSRLSNLAKQHGVPELQLEWAEQAVEQNPYDPITHSHLVDALICANRLYDASRVIDELEEKGDSLFIRTARARLLRTTGKFEAAREKYLQAVADFPNEPEVGYAKVGAVESLRDLGQYDLALKEYEALVSDEPLNGTFQCGLASVYMDLGLFERAIANFGKGPNSKDPVALNGRATAYKLAGKFDAALRLYDQVIREFPNDVVSLCGKAEVYRAQGNLLEALCSFDVAIERSPFTPAPVAGKLNVLRELRRFKELEETLQVAVDRFPYDHGIAAGYADILRTSGQLPEALAAYDAILQKFPLAIGARLARAGVLRRLNRPNEALKDYDLLLSSRPYLSSAKYAKASLLLEVGDIKAAEALIPETKPRSYNEWTSYFLRAMLYQTRGQTFKSLKLLEAGIRTTPFARQRRLFTAAFARQKIRFGEPSVAVKAIDAQPNEVSNVIRLHALAASGREGLAKEVWRDFSNSKSRVPPEIIEVAGEIARRFHIVSEAPAQTVDWIYQMETKLMLREAANESSEMDRAA